MDGNFSQKNRIVMRLKKLPIRAAKIFGPALINFDLTCNFFNIHFDVFDKILHSGRSIARAVKSSNRKTTGTILEVTE